MLLASPYTCTCTCMYMTCTWTCTMYMYIHNAKFSTCSALCWYWRILNCIKIIIRVSSRILETIDCVKFFKVNVLKFMPAEVASGGFWGHKRLVHVAEMLLHYEINLVWYLGWKLKLGGYFPPSPPLYETLHFLLINLYHFLYTDFHFICPVH